MKNKMTKVSVGVLLLASLFATTACQNVPSDKDRVPADPAAVSTSAPATSTDAPTLAPVTPGKSTKDKVKTSPTLAANDKTAADKANHDTPMSVNVAELVANKENTSDSFEELAAGKELDTTEAVRQGLETFQTVSKIKDLYKARDTTQDYNLIFGESSISSQFTVGYLDAVKAVIEDKSNPSARFAEMFPTADKDGFFGETKLLDGKTINLNYNGDTIPLPALDSAGQLNKMLTNIKVDAQKVPYTEAEKAEMAANPATVIAQKDAVEISGIRHQVVTNSDNKRFQMDYAFEITMIPSGSGWIVDKQIPKAGDNAYVSWSEVGNNGEIK